MRCLRREAMHEGAFGLSTTTSRSHVGDGARPLAYHNASREELAGLCHALRDAGRRTISGTRRGSSRPRTRRWPPPVARRSRRSPPLPAHGRSMPISISPFLNRWERKRVRHNLHVSLRWDNSPGRGGATMWASFQHRRGGWRASRLGRLAWRHLSQPEPGGPATLEVTAV